MCVGSASRARQVAGTDSVPIDTNKLSVVRHHLNLVALASSCLRPSDKEHGVRISAGTVGSKHGQRKSVQAASAAPRKICNAVPDSIGSEIVSQKIEAETWPLGSAKHAKQR